MFETVFWTFIKFLLEAYWGGGRSTRVFLRIADDGHCNLSFKRDEEALSLELRLRVIKPMITFLLKTICTARKLRRSFVFLIKIAELESIGILLFWKQFERKDLCFFPFKVNSVNWSKYKPKSQYKFQNRVEK